MLKCDVQAKAQRIQALEEEGISSRKLMQQNDQIIQHLRGEKTFIQDDLLGKGQRILNLEGEMREKDVRLEAWANEKAEMERVARRKT